MTEGGEVKEKQPERVSDVRVITRATYRFERPRLSQSESQDAHLDRGVPPRSGRSSRSRSRSRKAISTKAISAGRPTARAFTSSPTASLEPYYEPPRTDLYSVAPDGSDEKKVVSFDGRHARLQLQRRRQAHRVQRLADAQTDSILHAARSVCGRQLQARLRRAKNLTADYDFDIGGGIGGDQRAPRGGSSGGVIWSKDGRCLYVNVAEHGRANLKRIDAATRQSRTAHDRRS